jgi:hypothetical protein
MTGGDYLARNNIETPIALTVRRVAEEGVRCGAGTELVHQCHRHVGEVQTLENMQMIIRRWSSKQ